MRPSDQSLPCGAIGLCPTIFRRRRSAIGTDQKVAVITGASQGIGAALVRAYRDRNYRVVATARSIRPSDDEQVLALPGDIADRKTAERAICDGVARVGRIELL